MRLISSFLFLFLICLSACSTSQLYPQGVKPEVIALAKSNNREIILKVTNSFQVDSLGHQYLGILFPAGEIRHEFLEQALLQKLYTELTLRGYRPRIDLERTEKYIKIDELKVDLANVQLTAYDLLMTRKVVSKVKLKASYDSLRINVPISFTISSAYSEYKTMPFKDQLQRIIDKSLDSTIRDLLNQLRIK